MTKEAKPPWKNAKKEDTFKMELVKISTAGSVDDGKSTLIGRLLYDQNALTVEQRELIERKSAEKGWTDLDFSILTDGLVAEREQGITIDVAHIYFSSSDRKFIIADSPGHVEYTRNMVTGASTSDISLILVDARVGLKEQTYRHFFISNLLKAKKVIFCVNKMDLVDYSEDRFLEIAVSIQQMTAQINDHVPYEIVPISSLKGDNLVHRSTQTAWYRGATLDELLRNEPTESNVAPFRFDVQYVNHVQNENYVDYRAYLGRVLSGEIAVGDSIQVVPGNKLSRIKSIHRFTEELDQIQEGESVSILLEDDIDISRGSSFANQENPLEPTNTLPATLVWMDDRLATPNSKWILKFHSKEVLVKLNQIESLIDPSSFSKNSDIHSLGLNDIAEVTLQSAQPLFIDNYSFNPKNGAFILIDPMSNNTVALGFKKD